MSCNCYKANKIPACVTTLTIGTGTANTAYFVVFLSPTGRRDIYQVTADSGGVIAVESPGLRTGTAYQVWVSKLSNANVDVKDAFTPHGETSTVTCIDLEFTECTDAYTGGNVELDQTITLS